MTQVQILLIIIAILACASVACLVTIFVGLLPKLKKQEKLNDEIIEKNKEARQQLENNAKQLIDIQAQIDVKKSELTFEKALVSDLQDQRTAIQQSIIENQKVAKKTANDFYETCLDAAKERLSSKEKELAAQFEVSTEEYRKAYTEVLEDAGQTYREEVQKKKEQLAYLKDQINEYQAKVDAAVAANKRAEELKIKQDYYRLQLSPQDIEEIEKLRSIMPYLRQKEPLNKVIYKVYYEKPYSDLVGRVIGAGVHTGIYKITNTTNQMCYIGQAINLAERWKQHIRRGVGADAPTNNKLYPAMLTFGVENFTFEVVEECLPKDLNEREQYWQNYFKAKEFGYSIR